MPGSNDFIYLISNAEDSPLSPDRTRVWSDPDGPGTDQGRPSG